MKTEPIVLTEEQLPDFVAEFLVSLPTDEKQAQIIALRGDLGAGKTTFVKALGKALGVTEHITSPTFTILKQYETADHTWKYLLHMDAYRIEEISELGPLGFATLLQSPDTIFCIEWAENIRAALPNSYLELILNNTDDEKTRTIQLVQH